MKKALFWDFDGTLSYPNKRFDSALITSLTEIGCCTTKDEITEILHNIYSWKNPQIAYVDKTGELWWETVFEKIYAFCTKKNISSEDISSICKQFRKLLIDVDNYQLYNDSKDTLRRCRDLGYKNYLITNNYPEIVDNLKKLNIASFFSDFVVSSHIGYEKPRREFFEYAENIADHPDVGYVIGDNPIADIQGGKNAGYKTIAVHECRNSMADYYLEHLEQIFDILI